MSAQPVALEALHPFGLVVTFADDSAFADVDVDALRAWVDTHKVVVLRGLAPSAPHRFAQDSRRLGPLQPWPFGAVHELIVKADAENYLYTEHEVPLHWDGAFADHVPHYLVFQCLQAPPTGAGGETVFVDTAAVLAGASDDQRQRWRHTRVRYRTEKKAHYGGTFVSPVIATHPSTGADVIRYAEPVNDLNPVEVTPLDVDAAAARALQAELAAALHATDVELAVAWRAGDVVVADNHATLHGRRAFTHGAPRHIYRVNVVDDDGGIKATLKAAWRMRRPEFLWAELPILLIPALWCAPSPSSLLTWASAEVAALFFLLFHIGDMINCWFDRDVDLHRKTHLAEAIAKVGRRGVMVQIVVSCIIAVILGLHLGQSLQRAWLLPAGVVGAVVAAGYTAPPLRFKSRGLLQLLAYIGLLFWGPMIMIAGVFVDVPPPSLWALALGYGAMQTGILLVNTAEDLDEDEREGIRTAAVVMGARGTVVIAVAFVAVGAAVVAALAGAAVAAAVGSAGVVVVIPLMVCAAWNARWLFRLAAQLAPLNEAARRAAIRAQGKHVPRRIQTGAWVAFVVVAVAALCRWGLV